MVEVVVPVPQVSYVPVAGAAGQYPVRRIYCVGRNYAEHAREMGKDPARELPFFFLKPPEAIVINGSPVPYPPRTNNFHYEIELVAAIGKAGFQIKQESALEHVFGYAVGNDYTRRDLQLAARDKGRPWDTGKAFDRSAAIGAIHTVASIGHPTNARIWLSVNGEQRQRADIADLIWSVPEIIVELSTFYVLQPGDLIYTGTPAGVGPVKPGDEVAGGIEGLGTLENRIVAAT